MADNKETVKHKTKRTQTQHLNVDAGTHQIHQAGDGLQRRLELAQILSHGASE
jgi:hypothetical protein